MADPKDSDADGHIEDLLSQLQGIFGKLSHSEEEESKERVEPPKVSPAPRVPAPAPIMEPSPEGAPPLPDRSVVVDPPSSSEPSPAPPELPDIAASPAGPPASLGESVIPMMDGAPPEAPLDDSVVSTIVYYPTGRESETRLLSQKLETMAPKFTKVAFQLRVVQTIGYDPRNDPRETISLQDFQRGIRGVFCIVDRPLDEARKKALVRKLEEAGIYFQDVPLLSIEKKAFYTDILLGLVFFFDSQKSSTDETRAPEESL